MRAHVIRLWPRWIGYATAVWSLLYGLLGLSWWLGADGFPFGTGDPDIVDEGPRAIEANLLGLSTPEVAGPIIAALGLLGAVAAFLMARGWGQRAGRSVLLAFAGVAAIGLTILIQDYRPLVMVAYTPILFVGKAFFGVGWPEGVGLADVYPWPAVNLMICLLAGIAWALTAVAYRRRTSGSCDNCGRGDGAAASRLLGWGRPAVVVAFVTPMVYAATRWLWALGFSLGIDAEQFREGQESGMWLAGAALATSGALGAILTLGLVQRWGEVFPRWMIGLRGRRVPPMMAVVPATLVSILVTSAGSMYIRSVLVDGVQGKWATHMPETLWPIWGGALFVAAMSYHQRRRQACEICGRGVTETQQSDDTPALARV